mmetsp:Transcript_29543/g.78146  ORF Transcript_29543/g.78146 Transcript_29543/m.78146 type:complete len:267 (+) Transcript_29543:510-1310(+)
MERGMGAARSRHDESGTCQRHGRDAARSLRSLRRSVHGPADGLHAARPNGQSDDPHGCDGESDGPPATSDARSRLAHRHSRSDGDETSGHGVTARVHAGTHGAGNVADTSGCFPASAESTEFCSWNLQHCSWCRGHSRQPGRFQRKCLHGAANRTRLWCVPAAADAAAAAAGCAQPKPLADLQPFRVRTRIETTNAGFAATATWLRTADGWFILFEPREFDWKSELADASARNLQHGSRLTSCTELSVRAGFRQRTNHRAPCSQHT